MGFWSNSTSITIVSPFMVSIREIFGKVLLRLTTISCESGFIIIEILKMKELKSR